MLETDVSVPYGSIPTYDSSMPVRAPSGGCSYRFAGWQPQVSPVRGDTVYMAQYVSEPNAHSLTYVVDGSVVHRSTLHVGEQVPEHQYVPRSGFAFSGWDKVLPGSMPDEDLVISGTTSEILLTGLSFGRTHSAMRVGESLVLTPSFTPGNAFDRSLLWTVIGDAVTVDSGTVTAVKAGEATVHIRSVKDPDIIASCTFSVSETGCNPRMIFSDMAHGYVEYDGCYDPYSMPEFVFRAVPDEGYRFASLDVVTLNMALISVTEVGDGTNAVEVKMGQYFDRSGDGTIEIKVMFERIGGYRISVDPAISERVKVSTHVADASESVFVTVAPFDGERLRSIYYRTSDGSEFPIQDGRFDMPETSVTVFADFGPLLHKVTLDFAGGNGDVSEFIVEHDTVMSMPDPPVRDRYLFCGWDVDGALIVFDVTVVSDMTIRANWVPDPSSEYKVTFECDSKYGLIELNGTALSSGCTANVKMGKTPVENSNSVVIGTDVYTAVPVYGYVFDRWEKIPEGPEPDMRMVAIFSKSCELTFASGPHGGVIYDGLILPDGTAVSVPYGSEAAVNGNELSIGSRTYRAFVSEGYRFTGWNISSGKITSDTEISPLFEASSDPCMMHNVTVVPVLNGVIAPDASQAAEGTAVTIRIVPDSGYRLKSLSADGRELHVGEGQTEYCIVMPDHDVSVKGVFTTIVEERYHVELPSGTGFIAAYVDPEDGNVVSGGSILFTIRVLDGYTDSVPVVRVGTDVLYPMGLIYTIHNVSADINDITVQGVRPDTLEVRYVVDGETVHVDEVLFDARLPAYDYVPPEGHRFSGWDRAVPDVMPAGGLVLKGSNQEILLESLSFENKTADLMEGSKLKLNVIFGPSDALDKTLKWEVVGRTVAVDQDGTVTGICPGKSVIKITSIRVPGLSAYCDVTVSGMTCPLVMEGTANGRLWADVNSVSLGMTFTICAVPDDGYKFLNLSMPEGLEVVEKSHDLKETKDIVRISVRCTALTGDPVTVGGSFDEAMYKVTVDPSVSDRVTVTPSEVYIKGEVKVDVTLGPDDTLRSLYYINVDGTKVRIHDYRFHLLLQDVTVYADIDRYGYSVGFDMNGHGQQVPSQTVDYGSLVKEPPMPVCDSHVFRGWYTDPAFTADSKWDFSEDTADSDLILYAQWEVKTFSIVWKDDKGTVIDKTSVRYGETPAHEDAVKGPTEQWTFTFREWTPAIVPADCDAVYTANFDKSIRCYDVSFVANGSGYVSHDVISVPYGTQYVCKGSSISIGPVTVTAVPNESDAQFTYSFSGWNVPDGKTGSVNRDISFTASFHADVISYTVTFLNDDGSIIESIKVEYGQIPSHADAVKDPTQQYVYTFSGWNPEPVEVTGDAEYTAVFAESVRNYDISFRSDGRGSVSDLELSVPYGTQYRCEGDRMFFGDVSVRATADEQDAQYTYLFVRWDCDASLTGTVVSSMTFTACFSSALRMYTVTFVNEDGSVLQIGMSAYGSMPVYSGAVPEKKGNAQFDYIFNGQWLPALSEVVTDATYTAQFDSELVKYTISWFSDDGSLIDTTDAAYGTVPSHEDAVKESTLHYNYTFERWDPAPAEVSGDAEYTAVFSASINNHLVTFVMNGHGAQVPEVYVSPGSLCPVPADPVAEGLYFTGWHDDADCAAMHDFSVPVDSDLTLYAGWSNVPPETFTVTLPSGTGYKAMFTDGSSGTVLKGGSVSFTVDLLEGYTQSQIAVMRGSTVLQCTDGIYAIGGIVSDVDDITVTGVTPNRYTVTWDIDGVRSSEEYTYGQMPGYKGSVPQRAPTDQFTYTFSGWSPEPVPVSADVTYTAVFFEDTVNYLVSVLSGEFGTVDGNEVTVPYGTSVHASGNRLIVGDTVFTAQPDQPTQMHLYSFDRWYPSVTSELTVTGDITFTALFMQSVRTYDISINAEGNGTVSINTVCGVPYGGTITTEGSTASINGSTVYAHPGQEDTQSLHEFAGWTIDGTEQKDGAFTVTGPHMLCAVFRTVEKHTVSFEADGGMPMPEAQHIVTGSKAVIPELMIKDGFRFCGWFSDPAFEVFHDFTQPVLCDMLLYAKWVPVDTHTHDVTVEPSQNGTVLAKPWKNVTPGTQITLAASPASGFKLTDLAYNGVPFGVTDGRLEYTFAMPDAPVSVTAEFSPLPVYDVTLPSGVGFTAEFANGCTGKVTEGDDLSFRIILDSGYDQSEIAVVFGGTAIQPETGVYTIHNVCQDITGITVSGVEHNKCIVYFYNHDILIETVVTEDYSVIAPVPAPEDSLVFEGWYDLDHVSVFVAEGGETIHVEHDMKLFAKWKYSGMLFHKIEYGTLNYDSEPVRGVDWSAKIVPDKFHVNPADAVIESGGITLPGDAYSYDPVTGEILIPGSAIDGCISVRATCPFISYDVKFTETEGAVFEPGPGCGSTVAHGSAYTFSVDLKGPYDRSEITVYNNGVKLEPFIGNHYRIDPVLSPINLYVEGVSLNTYSVKIVLNGDSTGSVMGPLKIRHGDSAVYYTDPAAGTHVSMVKIDGVEVPVSQPIRVDDVVDDVRMYITFSLDRYDVKINCGAGGTASSNGSMKHGTAVTLRAEPQRGYEFAGWFENGRRVSLSEDYTFTIKGDRTFDAVFKDRYLDITLSSGMGYSIEMQDCQDLSVKYGGSFSFRVTVEEAYSTADMTVICDGTYLFPIDGIYTFDDVRSDVYVDVSGVEKQRFRMSVSSNYGGFTKVSSAVEYGGSTTLTVHPFEGFLIESVQIDGAEMGAIDRYEFTDVREDHSIVVKYRYNMTDIHVISRSTGLPIDTAYVEVGGVSYPATGGCAHTPVLEGDVVIRAEAPGYIDFTMRTTAQKGVPLTVTLDVDMTLVPSISSLTERSTGKNLMDQSITIERGNGLELSFFMSVNWNGVPAGTVRLYQNSGAEFTVPSDEFRFEPGTVFNAHENVYIQAVSITGLKTEPHPIGINIIPMLDKHDYGGEFKPSSGSIIEVNDPLLRAICGKEIKIDIGPIDFEVNAEVQLDGTVLAKVVFGFEKKSFHAFNNNTNIFGHWKEFKKVCSSAKQADAKMQEWKDFLMNVRYTGMLDGNMHALGFGEIHLDANGELIEFDGNINLNMGISASKGNTIFIKWVPLYYELGIGANIDMNFELDYDGSGFGIDTDVVLQCPIAYTEGGVGIRNLVSVGIQFRMVVEIDLAEDRTSADVDLNLKARVLFFRLNVTLANFHLFSFNLQTYRVADDQIDFERENRDYNSMTTVWDGSGGILQEWMYPEAQPQTVRCQDDLVMVFLADDPARIGDNYTRVMYTSYDGSSWSIPRYMSDNGNAEDCPVLFRADGRVFAAWGMLSTDTVPLDSEGNPDLLGMANMYDLCVSEWDSDLKVFGERCRITDDTLMDGEPVLASDGESTSLVWIQSDYANMKFRIMFSDLQSGAWSAPKALSDEFSGIGRCLSAAYSGGELTWAVDSEVVSDNADGSAVTTITMLYHDGMTLHSAATTSEGTMSDGSSLYYLNGRSLYACGSADVPVYEDINSSVRMHSNGGMKALTWTSGNSLMAATLINGQFHGPAVLYTSADALVSASAVLNADGSWSVVSSDFRASEGGAPDCTYMVFSERPSFSSVKLDSVRYDSLLFETGMQPFEYTVVNDGLTPVDRFDILVSSGTTVIDHIEYQHLLYPGQSFTAVINHDLSGLSGAFILTVKLSMNGTVQSETSMEMSFVSADLSADVHYVDSGFYMDLSVSGYKIAGYDLVLEAFGDREMTAPIRSVTLTDIPWTVSERMNMAYGDLDFSKHRTATVFLRAMLKSGETVLTQDTSYAVVNNYSVFSVTLPEGIGYRITADPGASSLGIHESFSFRLSIDPGYHAPELSVTANSVPIECIDGRYTVNDITDDQVISVTGVTENPGCGDFNGDGQLDRDDIVSMHDLFSGSEIMGSEYDINNDGTVDLRDYIALKVLASSRA